MTPLEAEQVRELGRQALAAERERCAKIVDMRAKVWEEAVKADMHSPCAMSLWEECEDIANAIRGVGGYGQQSGDCGK